MKLYDKLTIGTGSENGIDFHGKISNRHAENPVIKESGYFRIIFGEISRNERPFVWRVAKKNKIKMKMEKFISVGKMARGLRRKRCDEKMRNYCATGTHIGFCVLTMKSSTCGIKVVRLWNAI